MTGFYTHRMFARVLIIGALLMASTAAVAQPPGFGAIGTPISVDAFSSLSSVPQGGTVRLAVVLTTRGEWHVNANKVNDEFMIPTTLEVTAPEGVTVTGIVYPEAHQKQLSFSDTPLALYNGTVPIGVLVEVARTVEPGTIHITANLTYQACDNEKCLAPETKMIAIPLKVSPSTEAVDLTHPEVFEKIDFASLTASMSGEDGGAGKAAAVAGSGRLGSLIAKRGWVFAFFMVFVWGLALNLTPCVYPMIPITIGFFSNQAGGKTSQTLWLAVTYVLGMATMYSVLGLIAALTGSIFGTALQNPFIVLSIAAVMVGLAFSMFGFYEIRVPTRLANIAGASTGKQGPVGAFLMGLTVGIVAAPCVGPLVIALLTFVGESQNPALGFTLFFTLALGLGAPFMVVAVLSGNMSKLPKSGEWMEWVKKVFGVIMIGMAVYFLQPLINDATYSIAMALVAIIGGIVVGFIKNAKTPSRPFRVVQALVGIIGIFIGGRLLMPIVNPPAAEASIAWQAFDDDLIEAAKSKGQFVVIDFTAEWCLPCQELDHMTFATAEAITATSEMMTLRADLTKSASQEVSDIRKQYEIRGVPTVIFLDKNGKEREDLRIFGFVDKEDFVGRINKLKGSG